MSDDGFAPTLLLAMPQLLDPNFSRAVVLLCKHGDEGALGFVVNRPVDTTVGELLALDPPPAPDRNLSVWQGGPVSPERGWLLCRAQPPEDEGFEVCDGIYMTSSQAALRRMLDGDPRECAPDRSRLLLGYAGWGPGQLDGEMTESAWLNIPVDVDLVFDTAPEDLWEACLRTLGIDPLSLAPAPGVH